MKRNAPAPAAVINTAEDLLDALNRVKAATFGNEVYPFTMDQLRHFSDTRRNYIGYRTFSIMKKSGGVRQISAPCRMLKAFQSVAATMLQSLYQAPDPVMGFVPGRSIADNAARHVGKNYVFNADLKDFFPGVIRMMVQTALMRPPFNFGGEAAMLLSGLCCAHPDLVEQATPEYVMDMQASRYNGSGRRPEDLSPKGFASLPQGSPASPVMANAVCRGLDRRLEGLARNFGVDYSRYADDITFSANHNVFREGHGFMREFRRVVLEEGFELNESKLRLQEKGQRQEVTGLVVNRKVNVGRACIRSLGSLLYIWERHGMDAAYACFLRHEHKWKHAPVFYPDRISRHLFHPHLVETVQGRLAYLRMVRGADDPVWQKLDARFRRLREEFRRRTFPGTTPRYLHSWTVKRFEALTGITLTCGSSDSFLGKEWVIRLEQNGYRTVIDASRYCRTRIEKAAESGDPGELEKLKEEFRIGLCAALPKKAPSGYESADFSEFHRYESEKTDRTLLRTYARMPVFWKVFRRVPKKERELKIPRSTDRVKRSVPEYLENAALVDDLGLVWKSIEVDSAWIGHGSDEIFPFER